MDNMSCFHFLGIMNNAATNIHALVFLRTYVFIYLGYILRSGIPGSHGSSTFNLLKSCQTVFQSSCALKRSHQQHMRVPVFPYPHQLVISCLFDYSHPRGCEVMSRDFDLHVPGG